MKCSEESINFLLNFSPLNDIQDKGPAERPKPKVPEIKTPGGGQVLEAPKIEVIRESTPDRKSSLAPGVYCFSV